MGAAGAAVSQAEAAPESGHSRRPEGTAKLGSTVFTAWTAQPWLASQTAVVDWTGGTANIAGAARTTTVM
jgi:hypothetical protein